MVVVVVVDVVTVVVVGAHSSNEGDFGPLMLMNKFEYFDHSISYLIPLHVLALESQRVQVNDSFDF